MKKLIFFIPAIMFTILYGCAALVGMGTIHPFVIVWLLLFWAAGVLLSKAIFWGGLFGVIPATFFIYMGMLEAGQIMSETPIGIVVLLYYAVCIYYVRKRSRFKSR